ncbi:MAG TPA: hypothetical protein VF796_15180, partial [Humisphaera sp.]
VTRRAVRRPDHFHVWDDLAPLLVRYGLDPVEVSLDDDGFDYNAAERGRDAHLRIVAVCNDEGTSSERRLRPRWYRRHITVPDEHGFNGTVAPTPLGPVLAYRPTDTEIATVLLDPRMQPIDRTRTQLPLHGNADPRLVRHADELFLTTSWGAGAGERIELRRLHVLGDGRTTVSDVGKFDVIDDDPGYKRVREKNWTAWSWRGVLAFTHKLSPHRVLHTDLGTGRVRLVAETTWRAPWWRPEWGTEFRLNTPPVRVPGDLWLSTFHTVGSDGYYSGFYTFDDVWPFAVRQLSAAPVFAPGDATGSNRRTGARCLFFVGLGVDAAAGEVVLYGGDNDHSVIAVSVALDEVLAHLREVLH